LRPYTGITFDHLMAIKAMLMERKLKPIMIREKWWHFRKKPYYIFYPPKKHSRGQLI